MSCKAQARKRYIFASDFDQTLSFNASGYALSELLGIPVDEFARKAQGMAALNLVQQGGELAYLLLHDPEFRSRVRRQHLYEVGKKIRLKQHIDLLYRILSSGIEGYQFEFYVISAAPVEIVRSALEGMLPGDHIFGTEFKYLPSGEIDTILRAVAGYGKVEVVDHLQTDLQVSSDHIIYVGDGSSDIHVMLHVNHREGFTIAVSENKRLAPIARRTVLSDDAIGVLVPILEDIAGMQRTHIRRFFESLGFQIHGWDKVQTDSIAIHETTTGTLRDPLASSELTGGAI